MEPIKLEFIVKGDIDKELSRINLAIKGVGDQSYASFSRLLQDSDKSFAGLSAGTRSLAATLQNMVGCLRANEQAQQALYAEYEKGAISIAEYSEAQARLSTQQATLKSQAAELARQIENEIRQNGMASGSLDQKLSLLGSLQRQYAGLSEAERDNAAVGGTLATQIKGLNNEITSIQANLKQEQRIETLVDGSLQERIVTLSRLREEYVRLGKAERESMIGANLVTQIQQVDGEIARMQANMGRVGTGAAGFNSLGMSVQQVARELPSLTMGANMFFLAISNNLPILADNLRQARTEFNAMKASGQAATPVWKQVLSSLVSWQTALVVGVTLLSVYGKEIWEWTKSLFGAKKALDANLDSLDGFQKKVGESAGQSITSFRKMLLEWNALGDSLEAKKKYILDNASAFDRIGSSVTSVLEAETLFRNQGAAFIESLQLRAKAAAAMELSAEKYKEAILKMQEAESEEKKGVSTGDRIKSAFATSSLASSGQLGKSIQMDEVSPEAYRDARLAKLKKEEADYFTVANSFLDQSLQFEKERREALSDAGIATTDVIVANSVAAIEASIAKKKEALKKLTDKKAYSAAMAEIKEEEAQLKAITGDTGSEQKKTMENRKRLSEAILDNELKLQSGRISIMEDGKAKRIALAEQETRDSIAAIQKEKAEYRKGAKESKEKEDPTVIKTFDDRELAAKAKENADIARMEKEYADEYRQRTKVLTDVFLNEEERKLSAIRTRYAEERKWADQQLRTGGMTKDQHKSYTGNIDKAQQQETYRSLLDNLNDHKQKEKDLRDKWDTDIATATEAKDAYLVAKLMEGKQKALSSLNGQMLQESTEWQQLFGNLDNLTVDQISKLIETIKAKSKGLKLNPVDMKAVTDSLKEGENKIKTMNPFKSLSNHLREYKKTEGDVAKKDALKEMFRDTAASIDMVRESFDAVVGGLTDMGLAGDEATQQLLGDISNLMGAASQLATGIASMNPVSIIQGGIGVITSIFNIFNNDKRHERKIKEIQEEVDGLSRAYDRLGRAIDNTYDASVYGKMDAQAENLRRQQQLILQQMDEEDAKKKTDDDKIQEYRDKYEELGDQTEDLKKKQVEMLAGTDIQSAIDSFADALTEAYAQGEDGAKAMGETTKKILANAVREALKKQLLGKALEDAVNQLGKNMEDGILSDSEKRQFEDSANSAGRRFMEAMSMYDELFKGDDPTREATAKGIASISQDSANAIDGKMSSQLIYLDKTLVEVTGIRDQMRFIYALQVEGWKDVRAIRELSGKVSENTGKIAEVAGRIEELSGRIETNTGKAARGIQDMNDKGLILRSY